MMKRIVIIMVLLLCQSGIAFALKPSKTYAVFPDKVNFPQFRQDTIVTSDGFHLRAWRFWSSPSMRRRHQTVLIAGGDAGNMSNWLPLATALLHHGFDVITFDYRGFGGSDDFSINADQLYYNEFGEDLKAAIRFAGSDMPKEEKLVLYAFSMGTILAARVWHDAPADYFVGEGFVANPIAVQQRLLAIKARTFTIPADAAAHAEKVAALPARMLLFAGTQDGITTITDCAALKVKQPGIIIKTFEGGHGGGFQALMQHATDGEYLEAIIDFTAK